MAPKANSRAKVFADLGYRPAKDYDPEQEPQADDVESGDEIDSEDEKAETEHYVVVGKSKLRQKEAVSLGPQYQGTRVSRKALEEESDEDSEDRDGEEDSGDGSEDNEGGHFDDPDTADLEADSKRVQDDVEIESDNAFTESDKERYKNWALRGSSRPNVKRRRRPTAADFMSDSEGDSRDASQPDGEEGVMNGSQPDEEEGESGEDEEEDGGFEESSSVSDGDDGDGGARLNGLYDDRSGDSASDDEGDSDEDMDASDGEEDEDSDGSETGPYSKLFGFGKQFSRREEEEKESEAKASDPVKGNAEKGRAVRQQRNIFDGLLNIRIRLQKALVAANSFKAADTDKVDVGTKAYDAAEETAVGLWNMLDDLRSGIHGPKRGQKRKREVSVSTSTEDIWDYMQEDEAAARTKRQTTLNMWSHRVGGSGANAVKKEKLGTSTYSSVIEEQLTRDPDRFVRRTQVPRSCAPAQAAKKIKEDPSIYDDADFYQGLLKELVDLRSSDANTAQSAAVARERWAAMKEANPNKVVDRRASRGRKMRFTVHEKLVSFMAPEDRRSWEDGAIRHLFGTLLGQKMDLDEEESEENVIPDDGIRLYR